MLAVCYVMQSFLHTITNMPMMYCLKESCINYPVVWVIEKKTKPVSLLSYLKSSPRGLCKDSVTFKFFVFL